MAVSPKEQTCSLSLKVATGTSQTGKTTFGTRSLSYVNPALSDDDVVVVGAGFASLQSHALGNITRTDKKVFEV